MAGRYCGRRPAACDERVECEAGAVVGCRPTDGRGAICTILLHHSKDCQANDPECLPRQWIPTVNARDYAFWNWPTKQKPRDPATWPAFQRRTHFSTGYYGMVFDEADGQIIRLGSLSDETTMADGLNRSNTELTTLPRARVNWEAGPLDNAVVATDFLANNLRDNRGISNCQKGAGHEPPENQVRYGEDERLGADSKAYGPAPDPHECGRDRAVDRRRGRPDSPVRDALAPMRKPSVQNRAVKSPTRMEPWLFVVYAKDGSRPASLELQRVNSSPSGRRPNRSVLKPSPCSSRHCTACPRARLKCW